MKFTEVSSVENSMSVFASIDFPKSLVLEFSLSSVIDDNTQTTDLDLTGHFKLELPDNVNFLEFLPREVTQMTKPILPMEDIHEFDRQLRGSDNINLEIEVPLETSVRGLAPGGKVEEQVGTRTYKWSGENAADGLVSLLTGEMYVPPAPEEKAKLPWLWIGIAVAVIVVALAVVSRFRSRRG